MSEKSKLDPFSAESFVKLLTDREITETPVQTFNFNILKAKLLYETALEISPIFNKFLEKILNKSTVRMTPADLGLALYHVYTEQALVTAVSALEVYFKDRLACEIQNDVRLLNRFAEKGIKIRRILDAGLDLSKDIGILIVENMNFQILENIQCEYGRIFGFEPFTKAELDKLKVIFAIRHVIVHRSGIVDHLFVSETGLDYPVGKRLFFERKEILQMIEHIDRIVTNIDSKLSG